MRYKKLTKIIIRPFMALLILQLSCAPKIKKLPPPPSEQLRDQFGTIGVASAYYIPKVELSMPAKGRLGGAAKGSVIGGAETFLGAASQPGGSVLLGCLLAPVGALVGCISGGVAAPSGAKVEEAEAALRNVSSDPAIHQRMRDQFLEVAHEQTHHSFVVIEEQGPTAPDRELIYGAIVGDDIDTVVEISVLEVGLTAHKWGMDELFAFTMTLRTRVIRITDGEEVYAATLRYMGVRRTFEDWEANDFQLYKEEFSRCYSVLAEKIVEELFLLYPVF
jgi:hypothetical protein